MTWKFARRRLASVLLLAIVVACALSMPAAARAHRFETLVDFDCTTIGCAPNGVFLQARDGYFYGTTSESDFDGGDGTVFRMDKNGAIAVLPSPALGFFEAADGYFYGTSGDGGMFGHGAVYRMDTTGAVTVLHSFDGATATGPTAIAEAEDGAFYGVVGVPDTDEVRLFKMDHRFDVTLLHMLGPVRNVRTLISGSNHFLYGTTYFGGSSSVGTVFRVNRHGHARVLVSLPGTPGSPSGTAYGDLMHASDGYFYGTTIEGGAFGAGTLFRMSPSGKVTVLHSFDGVHGANPYVAPIEGRDGHFYGDTGFGGAFGVGTLYRMDRSGTFTLLHSFGGSSESGTLPIAPLVQADDGALYGVTVFGGLKNQGTAFRLRFETR